MLAQRAGEALELKGPWSADKYRFTNKLMAAVSDGKRPPISEKAVSTLGIPGYVELLQVCWSQDPLHRPTFSTILRSLEDIRLICCKLEYNARMDARMMEAVNANSKTGIEMGTLSGDSTKQGRRKSEAGFRMSASIKTETRIAVVAQSCMELL